MTTLEKIKNFYQQYLQNIWFFGVLSVISIIFITIFIINLIGGIKVSPDKFYKSLSGVDAERIKVQSVSLKIGFKLEFIAEDISINFDDFEVKLEQLILKKNFFNNNAIEFTSINGMAVLFADKTETIQSAICRLKKIFLPNTSGKQKKTLISKNLSLIVKKKGSGIAMSAENFNGVVTLINNVFDIKGTFLLNKELYSIDSISSRNSTDFNMKIEGENIVFKSFLEKERGRVSFSINNITNFLNIITPDTINFDFGGFDGSKNSFYFESDITYNDVRKSTEFLNSKLQIFGGPEENITIENLNNNTYKVNADIKELKIIKSEKSNNLVVPNSSTPNLQFGAIFPEIAVMLNISMQNIYLVDGKNQHSISNVKLDGKLGYGEIDFTSSVTINKSIIIDIKGFLYNYETNFRKGLFQFSISGKKVDLSNVNLFNMVRYNGSTESDFRSSFDALIMGDTGIIDNIIFHDNETSLRLGKVQLNLYLKHKSYFLNLDFEKLNLSNIKLIIPSVFKTNQSDFFRILFNYLKIKDFSSINIKCDECKISDKTYQVLFQSSIIGSKFEVEKFQVFNQDFGFNSNFIFDIRNLKNNLINFDINFDKWNNFEFKDFINISNFIESFSELKLPSFENFSGGFNINFKNIKGKLNTLNDLNIKLRLTSGDIKEISSSITFNGVMQENFLTLQSKLNTANPSFVFTASVPNIKIESVLKAILQKEDFNDVSGFMDVAVGGKTQGLLFSDLVKNLNANITLQSAEVKLQNFDLESLSKFLSNPNSIFKDITNKAIQDKVNNSQIFQLQSKMQFQNMDFNIENIDLKSISSSTIFVGKFSFLENNAFLLQLVGKSAIAGSDLNAKLVGLMPLYIATAISNTGKSVTIQFDYSQINKYGDARRVIYK